MDAMASDVERNKRVVRDQLAAMERQDAAAQGALMADDVRWWCSRTASGKDYLNQYHFLYRLDGGRIAEVWEHVDTAYAYARMAP